MDKPEAVVLLVCTVSSKSAVVIETSSSPPTSFLSSILQRYSKPRSIISCFIFTQILQQQERCQTPCQEPSSMTPLLRPSSTSPVPDPRSSKSRRLPPPHRHSTAPSPIVASAPDTKPKNIVSPNPSLISSALRLLTQITTSPTTPGLGTGKARLPPNSTIDQTGIARTLYRGQSVIASSPLYRARQAETVANAAAESRSFPPHMPRSRTLRLNPRQQPAGVER